MTANIEAVVSERRKVALESQQLWWSLAPRDRFRVIRRIAAVVSAKHRELAAAVHRAVSISEILASEVLPLADACRFAGKSGPQILAPQSLGWYSAAWWMGRIGVQQRREPWGLVLILAPWNYPLLLPGVQIVQAIAAGNAVLLKPSPGCESVMELFHACLVTAGVPESLVQILPSDVAAAEAAFRLGVDKVVLTGSAATGRAILQQLADSLTPATMELSGCDAVFVHPQANLERVAQSIAYALVLNAGATCIAPRRIFVTRENVENLSALLAEQLMEIPPQKIRPAIVAQAQSLISQAVGQGANILSGRLPDLQQASMGPLVLSQVRSDMGIAQADLFAPVTSLITVDDLSEAVRLDGACPYHLGASIFGPEPHASFWASKINAGCVTVNDIVVPTADPRVAFGGRGQSGWGLTRGAEGLLDMTRLKVVCRRRGRWMPHLNPQLSQDPIMLGNLLKLFHASSLSERLGSLINIVRSGLK